MAVNVTYWSNDANRLSDLVLLVLVIVAVVVAAAFGVGVRIGAMLLAARWGVNQLIGRTGQLIGQHIFWMPVNFSFSRRRSISVN